MKQYFQNNRSDVKDVTGCSIAVIERHSSCPFCQVQLPNALLQVIGNVPAGNEERNIFALSFCFVIDHIYCA